MRGREDMQASSDRVYKLTLASRRISSCCSRAAHDGVLAIRKSCMTHPDDVRTRGGGRVQQRRPRQPALEIE